MAPDHDLRARRGAEAGVAAFGAERDPALGRRDRPGTPSPAARAEQARSAALACWPPPPGARSRAPASAARHRERGEVVLSPPASASPGAGASPRSRTASGSWSRTWSRFDRVRDRDRRMPPASAGPGWTGRSADGIGSPACSAQRSESACSMAGPTSSKRSVGAADVGSTGAGGQTAAASRLAGQQRVERARSTSRAGAGAVIEQAGTGFGVVGEA